MNGLQESRAKNEISKIVQIPVLTIPFLFLCFFLLHMDNSHHCTSSMVLGQILIQLMSLKDIVNLTAE